MSYPHSARENCLCCHLLNRHVPTSPANLGLQLFTLISHVSLQQITGWSDEAIDGVGAAGGEERHDIRRHLTHSLHLVSCVGPNEAVQGYNVIAVTHFLLNDSSVICLPSPLSTGNDLSAEFHSQINKIGLSQLHCERFESALLRDETKEYNNHNSEEEFHLKQLFA